VGLFKHTSVVEALPAVLHRYHDVAKAAGGNLEAASLLRQLVINECKQSRAVVVGEIRMEYILADVFTSHTHVSDAPVLRFKSLLHMRRILTWAPPCRFFISFGILAPLYWHH
jgi:hypothetical protein